jgi:hypothetical protein
VLGQLAAFALPWLSAGCESHQAHLPGVPGVGNYPNPTLEGCCTCTAAHSPHRYRRKPSAKLSALWPCILLSSAGKAILKLLNLQYSYEVGSGPFADGEGPADALYSQRGRSATHASWPLACGVLRLADALINVSCEEPGIQSGSGLRLNIQFVCEVWS